MMQSGPLGIWRTVDMVDFLGSKGVQQPADADDLLFGVFDAPVVCVGVILRLVRKSMLTLVLR